MKVTVERYLDLQRGRTHDSQAGFTLAELLVAVAISSTIIVALAMAFIVTTKTTSEASTRLRESRDAQILATYFGADVGSASSIASTGAPAGTCGSGLPGATVALLQWTDSGTDIKQWYVRQPGTPSQLIRRSCVGGVVKSDITVVKNLATATLACYPAAAANCVNPARVELEIVATSGYTYTLRALPRSTGAAQILSAPPRVVSITRNAPADEVTNATSLTWEVKFSEPVRNVTSADFVLVDDLDGGDPTIAGLNPNVPSYLRNSWKVTAAVSSTSTAGRIQLELRDSNGSIRDDDGNSVDNPAFTGDSYTFDRVAPSVTLALAPGQGVSTNQLPIRLTATFSEPVAFDPSKITRSGSSTGGTISVAGSGAVYQIVVDGISAGSFTAQIQAGRAPDAAGNANSASAAVSVAYDPAMLVVRSIDRLDPNPTTAASNSLRWLVTFSEAVRNNTVSIADFQWPETMGGSLSTSNWTVTPGGATNSTTFTVTANTSSLSGDGTLRLDLKDDNSILTPSPASKPLGGTGSNNGDFAGQTYDLDKTPPTVTLGLASGQAAATNTLPLRFTATFSEPVVGFTSSDITVSSGTVTLGGAGLAYTIDVAAPAAGTVNLSVAGNRFTDTIGNGNPASNVASVYYDPNLLRVLSIDRRDPDPTEASSVSWLVTLNQAVSNSTVSISDFQWAETLSGSLSNANWTVAPGGTTNSTTFTVTANTSGLSGSGTLRLDLRDDNTIVTPSPTNRPLGGPGAGNGDFTGQAYTIDRSPPAITAVELKNKNGGIAGKIEQGDQIVVTFSRRMSVSSFCSTWTGDTANQVLSGNNQVTVTANERNGDDRIEISTTGCSFQFGTISLDSDSFVTSDVNFGGSNLDKSTIAWDATNFRLTITLGKASGATSVNAGSRAPAYSSDAGILSSLGGSISNSPFTLPSATQF